MILKIALTLTGWALWFMTGWAWCRVWQKKKKTAKRVQIKVCSRAGSGLFYYQNALVPEKKLTRLIDKFGKEGVRQYGEEEANIMWDKEEP